MLEGIVTVVLSAIMTALGFLVVRWLTSVDQKLQALEDDIRATKDECRSVYADVVRQADFMSTVKELRTADNNRRMAIDRLDRDISDIVRQNRSLSQVIKDVRNQPQAEERSKDGKSKR